MWSNLPTLTKQTSVARKCALSLIPVGLATTADIQRCQDDSTQRCYYSWTTPSRCCSCTAHQPVVSTSCRLHRSHWLEWCIRHRTTPLPPSYIGSCTGCKLVNDWIKSWWLSHTRCNPLVCLSPFIWDYWPVCTLRSSDKLSLYCGWVDDAMRAFIISMDSVWLGTHCHRCAKYFCTFRHILKLNCLIMCTVNANSLPSLIPPCASDWLAKYGAV